MVYGKNRIDNSRPQKLFDELSTACDFVDLLHPRQLSEYSVTLQEHSVPLQEHFFVSARALHSQHFASQHFARVGFVPIRQTGSHTMTWNQKAMPEGTFPIAPRPFDS